MGDCFIFWTKSLKDVQDFKNIRNRLYDSIQFTIKINESELPFLEILIVKEGRKNYTWTLIYNISADLISYLVTCIPFSNSAHSPQSLQHVWNSLPHPRNSWWLNLFDWLWFPYLHTSDQKQYSLHLHSCLSHTVEFYRDDLLYTLLFVIIAHLCSYIINVKIIFKLSDGGRGGGDNGNS